MQTINLLTIQKQKTKLEETIEVFESHKLVIEIKKDSCTPNKPKWFARDAPPDMIDQ